ncbi:helix-turn-helix domain-containing protein [Paenibacillus sp. FSL H3-0333]|uniref:helix-turn-helix domain-containing protein n=1 Tax=Paenibacillus sp. FSL H3-0333 TaxID=2921373 RepID=UPI0030F86232
MDNNQEKHNQLNTILDQLMTTEEASEYWGLSQDHVKRLCGDGTIVADKRGKTWLILKDQDNPKQRERDSK